MADEPQRQKRQLPIRRTAIFTGILLILAGYTYLSIPPEAEMAVATERAFTGIGLVIAGAALWMGTLFFTK